MAIIMIGSLWLFDLWKTVSIFKMPERRRKISRGKYRKEVEQPGKELEDVEEGRSLNSPMWAFLVGGVLGEGFPHRE